MKDRRDLALAGLLLATLLWVAQAAPDLVAQARAQVESGGAGSAWRLGAALAALLLSLLTPLMARRRPAWTRGSLWAALALLTAAAWEHTWHDAINPDEMFHLHVAWMVSVGLQPYRDFFHHQQPLWYWLSVPLMRAMHDNLRVVLVARTLTFLETAAALFVAARIVRRLNGTAVVCPILLLCLSGYVDTGYQVRPEPTLLLLLTLDMVLQGRPLWGGLLAGLTWYLSPKGLVPLVVIGLFQTRPQALRYYGVIGVMAVVFALWLVDLGVVGAYLNAEFRFNSLMAATMHTGTTWWHNTATLTLWHQFLEAPPLVLLGAVGAWSLGHRREALCVTATLLVAWLFVLATRLGQPQYTLFPWTLVGVAAAAALPAACFNRERLLGGALPSTIVLLVASVALLRDAAIPPAGVNLEAAETALAHVAPGGTYYAPDVAGELSHPIFRRDASFYPQLYVPRVRDMLGTVFPLDHPLTDDLVAHPPDAMRMDMGPERDALLARLAAAGFHYRDVGDGVLARERTQTP